MRALTLAFSRNDYRADRMIPERTYESCNYERYSMARRRTQSTVNHGPFLHDAIPLLTMADHSKLQLFTALGQTPRPFHGAGHWPDLDQYMVAQSRAVRTQHGEDKWRSIGGRLDTHGEPTFAPTSPVAATAMRKLAHEPGGCLWTENDLGMRWAVRLQPGPGPEQHAPLFGFAVTWAGMSWIFDPHARARKRQEVQAQLKVMQAADVEEHRRRLEGVTRQLWLYNRAELLLWWVHAAVVAQRKSTVLLPDVLLAEAIWGTHRTRPSSWRDDIMAVFRSLCFLHAAEIRVTRHSWRPRFDSQSACLTVVRDLSASRSKHGSEDQCRPCCPLWREAGRVRHHHYLVGVGPGFLGHLEHYRNAEAADGTRSYDFAREPEGDAAKALQSAREAGQVVSVYMPPKLVLASKEVTLSPRQRQLLQGLVREVTRGKNTGKAPRPDHGMIVTGPSVPAGIGKGMIVCPLLAPGVRYIGFNGNGARRGRGYRIIGAKGTGWLSRCGYVVARDLDACTASARSFLADLDEMATSLGLVVVGLEPRSKTWLTLAEMRELAKDISQWPRLDALHLRFYTRADYLERWKALFVGAVDVLVFGDNEQDKSHVAAEDLWERMQRAGWTQQRLAKELSVKQPFLSQIKRGERGWPPEMLQRAEQLVASERGVLDSAG